MSQEEVKLSEALSSLPGKILGYSDKIGVYYLTSVASGGSNMKTTVEAISKSKFELDKSEPENYLRYSYVSMQIRNLMGEVLTTLEASITDERQLKASKSIIKNYFGRKLDWIYENCHCPNDEQEFIGEE